MLTSLRLLEADILAMRDDVDANKAAVYERNPLELAERETLFLIGRPRLCAFFGVAPGPGLFAEAVASAATAGTVAPAVFTV